MELSEEAYDKAAQAEVDERNAIRAEWEREQDERDAAAGWAPLARKATTDPPIMRPIEGKWGVV